MENIQQYIVGFLSVLALFAGFELGAQKCADLDKIAASQAGSSPLLFTVPNDAEPPVVPGNFSHSNECIVRSGIPNLFHKVRNEKEITVAFIGGSITQGRDSYRMQTARYMQNRFPGIVFRWVNAGVSGTGTDLGAFRIYEHVLRFQPDLIFIEFAVNGAYQPGMEGMIRQIIKANPHIDICLIYTIQNGQTEVYQRGEVPGNIQGLERIAEHYHLPAIHLGMEAAALEAQDKLLWKGMSHQAGERILFSKDGIHPDKIGGDLYAAAIARAIDKMDSLSMPEPHTLPVPLITDAWDGARMYEPQQIAVFDASWTPMATGKSKLKQFQGWFDKIMTAHKPGASFTFFFEGDQFGIFDIGGPEVGPLSIWIDDRPVGVTMIAERGYRLWEIGGSDADTTLNRFNRFCNNRYRGQYDVIQLHPGRHKVTLKISPAKADKHSILGPNQLEDITENPERYDQSAIYLGRILLRGKPVKEDQ